MEVILLENIRNLGPFGKTVKVAKGYGRNFLIPQGKAVPATKSNVAMFDVRRQELEAAANDRLVMAQKRGEVLAAARLNIAAKAADEGKLYGSVGTVDIVKAFKELGHDVTRQEIRLPLGPIREIGEYVVELHLHAEVVVEVPVQVTPESTLKI
jgi:large subunit ribosomal protein L9